MALTRRQKNTVRDFFKRGIRYLVEIQTYLRVRPGSIEYMCLTEIPKLNILLVNSFEQNYRKISIDIPGGVHFFSTHNF